MMKITLLLSFVLAVIGKGVVITGGSKGVGYHLARQFLIRGHDVVICGRTTSTLDTALSKLSKLCTTNRCYGITTDVSKYEDVLALGEFAERSLSGGLDIWINNAGSVAYQRKALMDLTADDLSQVVGTNMLGTMFGCKVAIEVMRRRRLGDEGHIYNMDGSGVDGGATDKYAAYGATKRAMPQLTKSINKELRDAKVSSVTVHNLSPGMVLTDLLLSDSTPVVRKFFNVLAEEPDTVASDLVPRILAVNGNTPTYIRFLTNTDAIGRILGGLPQVFLGGRFFDAKGNRVKQEGAQYNEKDVRIDL
jgi:chlorophyll(ide) b reductase